MPRRAPFLLLLAHALIAAALILPSIALAQPPRTRTRPTPVRALKSPIVRELLDGVNEIASPGIPGSLAVWGDDAVPVITGRLASARAAIVAAGTMGKGRFVAFAHSGYVDPREFGDDKTDTRTLIWNSIRWAANVGPDANPRVGLVAMDPRGGFDVGHPITVVTLGKDDWLRRAGEVDVLVFGNAVEPSMREASEMAEIIRDGKGVLIAQTGWGWQQTHGGAPMYMHPFSRMLEGAGVWWSASLTEDDKPDRYVARNAKVELLHAGRALEYLIEINNEKLDPNSNIPKTKPDPAYVEQSVSTLTEAAKLLPGSDTILRPRLERLLIDLKDKLVPSEEHPISSKEPLLRALVAFDMMTMMQSPEKASHSHPAALVFPGGVPDNAPRIVRDILIDTSIPGWHSTGLYAAPGEPVRYEILGRTPDSTNPRPSDEEPFPRGEGALRLRFGCHRDVLWSKDQWKRLPDIAFSYKIESDSGMHVTPFGGLLYIDVASDPPSPAPSRNFGTLRIRLSGAAEAPLFILGKTSVQDWKDRIRHLPGPWGELASDKVILSVPSCLFRTMDDPTEVLNIWGEVLDAAADLAARPRVRERPERYVADVQISNGYMHAGYPIMTHLDAATHMVSAADMRKGQWGLFHELGHNHQDDAWTFNGTREVTCNLFTLYILETVCRQSTSSGHDAFKDRDRRTAVYLAKAASRATTTTTTTAPATPPPTGAGEPAPTPSTTDPIRYEQWKKDPFLALFMYCQLREAFGWEPFKKVFAEVAALPNHPPQPKAGGAGPPAPPPKPMSWEESLRYRPQEDVDKRDQWMVRFSRAVGKNLGPFFEMWGVPTSSKARESIKDLPEWLPAQK
jgi:hypothetical protein